ncbi:MAG: hypothetical protein KC731_07960 [Myxococcales bacterium]|nr:hypothetical protein [Myxococcales bacterium]
MKYLARALLSLLVACEGGGADPKPDPASTSDGPTGDGSAAGQAEGATKPAADPGGAPAATGPWTDFGAFINEAGKAVLLAAQGEQPDAKWTIEPLADGPGDKLANAKIAFTSAEIEAMGPADYLRTNVVVFPDNSVKWVGIEHRPGAAHVGSMEGLEAISPVLAGTTKRLIETLSGDACDLPVMTPADELPAMKGQKIPDVKAQLAKTCASMKGKATGWVPRYDDFTVIATIDGGMVSIRSGLQLKDGKLVLNKPRVR